MPNISQQDYIIIDWEGKTYGDAAKKAEVDAILKNLYTSNPLSLLSVVFKDYGESSVASIMAAISGDDAVSLYFLDASAGEVNEYEFSIA